MTQEEPRGPAPSFLPGLLLVTDRRQALRPLAEICREALEAGFRGILLREKDLPGGDLLDLAGPLWELCRSRGAAFLVSDRLDVAMALPGTGAHVGASGLPVAKARGLLGPRAALGYSAHDVQEAGLALGEGADYVTLSPIFPSRSKPDLKPRGIEFLRTGVETLRPGTVVALGGIDAGRLRNIGGLRLGGAAVMGEVMRAEDPYETSRWLVQAWEAGKR